MGLLLPVSRETLKLLSLVFVSVNECLRKPYERDLTGHRRRVGSNRRPRRGRRGWSRRGTGLRRVLYTGQGSLRVRKVVSGVPTDVGDESQPDRGRR